MVPTLVEERANGERYLRDHVATHDKISAVERRSNQQLAQFSGTEG